MTDTFSTTTYRKGQRLCLWCKGGIATTRPVFLVTDYGGRILGPFHAGCAERLKIQAERMGFDSAAQKWDQLGTWPTRREETLPE